jgi:hypothetical protein
MLITRARHLLVCHKVSALKNGRRHGGIASVHAQSCEDSSCSIDDWGDFRDWEDFREDRSMHGNRRADTLPISTYLAWQSVVASYFIHNETTIFLSNTPSTTNSEQTN